MNDVPAAALTDPEPDAGQVALQDELSDYLSGHTTVGAPAGYYIHGPAGRGKTWLAGRAFAAAPVPDDAKVRIHFHSFFERMQRGLAGRGSSRSAIEQTVAALLDGIRLCFFDELHIHDPGGASLLNHLLAELVDRSVPTLITSNYEPEGLLPHRLYHHVAVPGIRTIRENFEVRLLDGGVDYRRPGSGSERFARGSWIVAPAGHGGLAALTAAGLRAPTGEEATSVLKAHHALRARAVRGREVWFDFADLLEVGSVSGDYLELARRFDAWVVTGVPAVSGMSRNARKRLVDLLDVLVDADRMLTVVASVPRTEFVDMERALPADMFRAQSRLAMLREQPAEGMRAAAVEGRLQPGKRGAGRLS